MINLRNYKKELEQMAVAAKQVHEVQVGEVTEGVYTKLNEGFDLYNIEHQMGVDVILAETTKGSYIIVVAEKNL